MSKQTKKQTIQVSTLRVDRQTWYLPVLQLKVRMEDIVSTCDSTWEGGVTASVSGEVSDNSSWFSEDKKKTQKKEKKYVFTTLNSE